MTALGATGAGSGQALLERARVGEERAFSELTGPHRRELQFHCYRMLGSLQDAEDMLQETLLAAWRGLPTFEGRSSLRVWLYRIATNRCLNALRDRPARPESVEPPFAVPEPTGWDDLGWLEPYPEALLEGLADADPGPAARYELREGVELSFIAGLQRLPARQRAAVVLRDALGFRTDEVADMLETSEAAVKSALQRARASLDQRRPASTRERAPAPHSPAERDLVARFADSFLSADVTGLIDLLTDDALMTMPPAAHEYEGREAIAAFLRASFGHRAARRVHLLATRANTQAAFASYLEDTQAGVLLPAGLIVLGLGGDRIATITRFHCDQLLLRFGLPQALPAQGP